MRSKKVKATPEEVWRAIAPMESLPSWGSGVQAATHLSGPKEGKGRRQRLSRTMYKYDVEIDQEVVVWEPGRRLEMAHLREATRGRELRGVRNFRTAIAIAPAKKGAKVSAEYAWDARVGLPWLFSILFGGRIMGRELKETLARIETLVAGK